MENQHLICIIIIIVLVCLLIYFLCNKNNKEYHFGCEPGNGLCNTCERDNCKDQCHLVHGKCYPK